MNKWPGFGSPAAVFGSPQPTAGDLTPKHATENAYRWAVVEVVSPLTIRFDGDTATLPMVPDTLVDPVTLGVGNRVWVQLYGLRVIIIGRAY